MEIFAEKLFSNHPDLLLIGQACRAAQPPPIFELVREQLHHGHTIEARVWGPSRYYLILLLVKRKEIICSTCNSEQQAVYARKYYIYIYVYIYIYATHGHRRSRSRSRSRIIYQDTRVTEKPCPSPSVSGLLRHTDIDA